MMAKEASLSVIVPVAGNELDRRTNTIECFQCIVNQVDVDCELVVVEQSLDGNTYWDDYISEHGWTYQAISDPVWCPSWCRNVGARLATGDLFFFIDADIVFDDNLFRSVLQHIQYDLRYLICYSDIIFLSRRSTNVFLQDHTFRESLAPSEIQGKGFSGVIDNASAGGIVLFSRKFFLEELGGYNENFYSWCKEDKDALIRALSLCNDREVRTFRHTIFHLFHINRQPDTRSATANLIEYSLRFPHDVSRILVNTDLGNIYHKTEADFSIISSREQRRTSLMISVITGIATMRSSDESNRMAIENFVEFQKCFFNQTFESKELILVELREPGAEESQFTDLIDPRATHVVVYNDRFVGAWVLNVGAKVAKGDFLAFIDADVVYGDDYLECVAKALAESDHPYLQGFDYSYWLSKDGRARYLRDRAFSKDTDCESIVTPHVLYNPGLSVICRRDFYFDVVGGHNESFIEGGGRDNDFAFRVVAEAGEFPGLSQPIIHLWHGGKIWGDQREPLWHFTYNNPKLVTKEIKRQGVGDPIGPRGHSLEEWQKLADG